MKRHVILTLVLMLGIGLILGGCATSTQTASSSLSANELVEEARKNICEISVSEAKDILIKEDVYSLTAANQKNSRWVISLVQ